MQTSPNTIHYTARDIKHLHAMFTEHGTEEVFSTRHRFDEWQRKWNIPPQLHPHLWTLFFARTPPPDPADIFACLHDREGRVLVRSYENEPTQPATKNYRRDLEALLDSVGGASSVRGVIIVMVAHASVCPLMLYEGLYRVANKFLPHDIPLLSQVVQTKDRREAGQAIWISGDAAD